MTTFDIGPPKPVAASATVSSAPTNTTAPIYDRSTDFKAVENAGETRSGATLMVEAYVVLWVLLMGWIVMLWRKQGALTSRLDDLERAIDKRAEQAETDEKKA